MPFDPNNLPEWNVEGVEPPQSKKDSGWGPGEKPPADWFNWFFSRTYNALKSLFTNAQHKEEKGQPNGYASLDENAKVPTSQLPTATPSTPGAMSASDKAKLDGIQSGAEVNQNAFSNVKVGATTIAADNKTDTLELVAGNAVTLTPDAANDRVTIAVPNATSSTAGAMSASDKAKLDGIAPGAEVNQNAFSNVKVGTTTIAADSKTDTLELVAGSNISLTPDAANDKITIAANVPVTSVNGKTGAVSLTASDVGAETPSGAQAKADQAETNAKSYADQVAATAEANAKAASAPISHVGAGGSAHATATQTTAGFMSASDKAKLDGIQSGAEVNQNTFANVKVGATTIAADAKQDTLELAAGTGVVLTPDATNDKVTIAVNTASTSQAGIVQLVDSVSSTSTTQAPTANAVKQANDNANNRVSKSGDTMTGALTVPNLIAQINIPSSSPPSAWPTGFVAGNVYNNGYPVPYGTIFSYKGTFGKSVVQILQAWPGSDGGEAYLYIRSARDTGADVFGPWRKVWSENNDGAGSGLDADTVDGKQASDFVWKTEKGAPNGVATLDANGKVPASQLNVSTTADAISITDTGNYYTGADVEAALQEIGQTLNAMRGDLITSVNNVLNM